MVQTYVSLILLCYHSFFSVWWELVWCFLFLFKIFLLLFFGGGVMFAFVLFLFYMIFWWVGWSGICQVIYNKYNLVYWETSFYSVWENWYYLYQNHNTVQFYHQEQYKTIFLTLNDMFKAPAAALNTMALLKKLKPSSNRTTASESPLRKEFQVIWPVSKCEVYSLNVCTCL